MIKSLLFCLCILSACNQYTNTQNKCPDPSISAYRQKPWRYKPRNWNIFIFGKKNYSPKYYYPLSKDPDAPRTKKQ